MEKGGGWNEERGEAKTEGEEGGVSSEEDFERQL